MANLKRRAKAPKSAPTKRGRGRPPKKLIVKKSQVHDQKPAANHIANTAELTSQDLVGTALRNGHLLKNNLSYEINQSKSAVKRVCPSNWAVKFPKTASLLLRKRGKTILKGKEDSKMIDDILKRELLIDMSSKTSTICPSSTLQNKSLDNNNDSETSDQNDMPIPQENGTKLTASPSKNNKVVQKLKQKPIKRKTVKSNKEGSLLSAVDKCLGTSEKSTTTNVENIPKKRSKKKDDKTKAKQVTLSNGLVLTLSTYRCDYCNKEYTSKPSLRRHIYSHIKVKYYKCSYCLKKFDDKIRLKKHKHLKHSDEFGDPYTCSVCNKSFLLKENLKIHFDSHVKTENCIYCNKKFSHHLLLLKHEKKHLVTGQYPCTICDMSFLYRNNLSAHVKSHLKIKDYICQFCAKEFMRINSLKRHVQTNHNGHMLQCPICKKKLKGHLTEHMRTHDKKRPHRCSDCGQSFTQATQLTVHRRSHTGDKPYVCGICKKTFSHSNALMLHVRRHTGERPFSCILCPMTFSQLPHMKTHMRKIHKRNEPYRCLECNQFFKLKLHLEIHRKKCTSEKSALMSFEEKLEQSVRERFLEEDPVVSSMSLSRMRFLVALLLTMIATKDKLSYLATIDMSLHMTTDEPPR